MRPEREPCVDASLAIMAVVGEDDSDKADALFERWRREGRGLIAPAFFEVEADSIWRKKSVLRGSLTHDEADDAFERLLALPIEQVSVPGQRRRAWTIASELGLPNVYDATYLALADLRGCEFWTADERLFNQVGNRLPFVRFLGTASSP